MNVSVSQEVPALKVEGLVKHFRSGRGVVRAVDGVDLTIGQGEIVGLVGESGSGKSTVGRCIARLLAPTEGRIELLGQDITHLNPRQMRKFRQNIHMVFQDPYSSLNPRMTVGDIIAEPIRQLRGDGRNRKTVVAETLERVGLRRAMAERYPHELSGGQRQRVALGRSLVLGPKLVIADEPVSALDVSVQASILNLILDLQADLGFSCLFVTHDLSVVEFISDRIAVMYLGQIVEFATREELFQHPQHPYTQSLFSAAPVPDPRAMKQERIVLQGEIPSPAAPPSGCRFHTRCPIAADVCRTDEPGLSERNRPGHLAACHFVTETSVPELRGSAAVV